MSDKADSKKQTKLLDIEEDIDSIPIVKLSLEDFGSPKSSKKHKKKSKGRKVRLPSPPPPVYAPEEMPEEAVDSGSEQETKPRNKREDIQANTYTKSLQQRDIFATDDDGLNTVDLSMPLGADEQLPQVQAYLSPEELRRREEARVRAERKEKRLAKEAQKKASTTIAL